MNFKFKIGDRVKVAACLENDEWFPHEVPVGTVTTLTHVDERYDCPYYSAELDTYFDEQEIELENNSSSDLEEHF